MPESTASTCEALTQHAESPHAFDDEPIDLLASWTTAGGTSCHDKDSATASLRVAHGSVFVSDDQF